MGSGPEDNSGTWIVVGILCVIVPILAVLGRAQMTPYNRPLPAGWEARVSAAGEENSADHTTQAELVVSRRDVTADRWSDQTASTRQIGAVAASHAECPICFEPLHKNPSGVFLDAQGHRASRYFYHLAAAQQWLDLGNNAEPVTRNPIARVVRVPSVLENPSEWFRVVDGDGNGRLDKTELLEALKAQLPLDLRSLDQAAENGQLWAQWDPDGSGSIEESELSVHGGIIDYIRSHFAGGGRRAIPSIQADRNAWYDYFDESGGGTLDKEEVVRALIKTFNLSTNVDERTKMRGTIDAIWPLFDDDGSGEIDRPEFLRAGEGLADTIIATMGFVRQT